MQIVNLGLISYAEALDKQLDTLDKVAREEMEEVIFICSHPPVLTLGRATQKEDVGHWTGEVHEVQRGGRVTFHGPGQIVAYPILRLNDRGRDLHKYLRQLEDVILKVLKSYQIVGRREDGATGVWVGDKKIASIGIAAKKWVTYHGLAFNYENEFMNYGKFSPCGFHQTDMIGLVDLLNDRVDRLEIEEKISSELLKTLN